MPPSRIREDPGTRFQKEGIITAAEPEKQDAETADLDGVKLYFQGGRGTGYFLEWDY